MAAVVTLERIGRNFGDFQAVADLNLEVQQGQFMALLGPSGCGKSTTLRLIAGYVAPSYGRVLLAGADATPLPPEKRNIGMVFQSYALFPHLTVAQNVAFGLQMRRLPKAEITPRVAQALALVGLGEYGNRYPKQLSGGQQQRVALARAIVIQPTVLLLDEPLSGLDAQLRQQMQYELKRIQRETGLTTIMVTHDQAEALALADQIVILNQGRLEQKGSPQEIFRRPASRFVADFLGFENFLTLPERGLTTIRPEYTQVLPPGSTAPGVGLVLPGQVATSTFLGTDSLLTVKTEQGELRALSPANGWCEGDQVTLFLPADELISLAS